MFLSKIHVTFIKIDHLVDHTTGVNKFFSEGASYKPCSLNTLQLS